MKPTNKNRNSTITMTIKAASAVLCHEVGAWPTKRPDCPGSPRKILLATRQLLLPLAVAVLINRLNQGFDVFEFLFRGECAVEQTTGVRFGVSKVA